MAKAPAAGKARTKSKDTEGAPPVPDDTTALADVTAGAERAESTAGSDPVGDAATIGRESNGEAGKGDGAAAGSAPEPGTEQECLVVIGPARGRRRCGVRFGPQPEAIPIAWLNPGEAEAIEADPVLTVTREMRLVRPR